MRAKLSTYVIDGELAIFTTATGDNFTVDADVAEKMVNYPWRTDKNGYIYTRKVIDGRRIHIQIHRHLTEAPADKVVDHINHNVKDNRMSNLRVVTTSENLMNRGIDRRNKSGATGVFWNRFVGRWFVYITINRKINRIGWFDDYDDAVLARKEAESKYFGEFAYKAN